MVRTRVPSYALRRWAAVALAALAAAPLACGSVRDTAAVLAGDGGLGSDATSPLVNGTSVMELTIDPSQATLVTDGSPSSIQFRAVATLEDGSSADVSSSVTWGWDQPALGSVDGTGFYTAAGALGGMVAVSASFGGKSGAAVLTVELVLPVDLGGTDPGAQGPLQGATGQDPNALLAYPYDRTVFPRGVGEAPLMWLGAAAGDVYLVHLSSATFDYQAFFGAPAGRYDFDATIWQKFTDSTSGAASMKLARWNGSAATVVADQSWTIAPGSMRGTVYYWSVNAESVVRLTGGATAPENFLGSSGPAENHAPYCPSCHTVSADGSRLVMNEGTWGASPSPEEASYLYDLRTDASAGPFLPNAHTSICESDGCPSEWGLAAVSPDGTTVVENFSPLRGQIGQTTGAFDSSSAQPIAGSGLEGKPLCMPAFSPDGLLLAYVDCATMDLRAFDWDPAAKKATNDRLLEASAHNAGSPQIQYPTVSPDHQWVAYARGPALGSLGNPGDLYVASVASAGSEVALAALNGTGYPFAAGARDLDLNFEPTFAPVASGGYFWIVFHSRRTWGNAITKAAYVKEGSGVKQLWVSAFDQSPRAGVDPSHAAFHLPGQATTLANGMDPINMRAYWALGPCKEDGQACGSGSDCCGGYCAGSGGGSGACGSASSGCSRDGEKCAAASDCCEPNDRCINGYCAQPPLP
ncbi:MAG TPA: hypothetical protein VGI39_31830 [Polyangiaceae bacterium]